MGDANPFWADIMGRCTNNITYFEEEFNKKDRNEQEDTNMLFYRNQLRKSLKMPLIPAKTKIAVQTIQSETPTAAPPEPKHRKHDEKESNERRELWVKIADRTKEFIEEGQLKEQQQDQ